jgi:hypothetical protein
MEITGGLRKLHDKKLYSLYFLPNVIKLMKPRDENGRHVRNISAVRNAYKILCCKS